MPIVTIHDNVAVVLRPRDPNARTEAVEQREVPRSTCSRCRQSIVQGVIAGASETWATAAGGDPWCEGGVHLPKAADHTEAS